MRRRGGGSRPSSGPSEVLRPLRIVLVEKGDPVAAGFRHTSIAGCGLPTVDSPQELWRQPPAEALHAVQPVVGRAVVDDDDTSRRRALGTDALQGLLKVHRAVEQGDYDDGQERHPKLVQLLRTYLIQSSLAIMLFRPDPTHSFTHPPTDSH